MRQMTWHCAVVLGCVLWLCSVTAGASVRNAAGEDRVPGLVDVTGSFCYYTEVLSPGGWFSVVSVPVPACRDRKQGSPDHCLYMMNARTGRMRKIYEYSTCASAIWSPDGRHVVIEDDTVDAPNWCIFATNGKKVFDFAESIKKTPARHQAFPVVHTSLGTFEVAWVTNSSLEILGMPGDFQLPGVEMMFDFGPGLTRAHEVWISDADTISVQLRRAEEEAKQQKRFLGRVEGRGSFGECVEVVSPTGRFSIVSIPDPTYCAPKWCTPCYYLYMMDVRTGNLRKVGEYETIASAEWSPDGDKVVVEEDTLGSPNCWVFSSGGRKRMDFVEGIQANSRNAKRYPYACNVLVLKEVSWLANNRLEIVGEPRYEHSADVKLRIEVGRGLIEAWELPGTGGSEDDVDDSAGPEEDDKGGDSAEQ